MRPALPATSDRPDLRTLAFLGDLEGLSLPFVAVLSGIILCAWIFPAVGRLLPTGWDLMKANTAALILLSGLSLALSRPKQAMRSVFASRMIAAFIFLLSSATLLEYSFDVILGFDTLIAADAQPFLPGRMSVQTAVSLLLLGSVLFHLRARKRLLAYLIDALTLCLSLLILVFAAGYAFGAMRLFGLTVQHRLSLQTLLCLGVLTILVFNRRTEYGIFSILIDEGIGGKTARIAVPCAIFLPFMLTLIRGVLLRFDLIEVHYAVVLTAALLSLFSFCFVLFVSRRCKHLENEVRELSLRDQLTRLYNRRGFYLFAEQGLRLACRSHEAYFLLFIDMDNLKQVNDELGHDAGSDLLREMATLLDATFRETDVIGRLGGDEFVVAGRAEYDQVLKAVARLEETAETVSAMPSRSYPLSFSLGCVMSSGNATETLEDLLHRADSIMYEAKREKKQRDTESTPSIVS